MKVSPFFRWASVCALATAVVSCGAPGSAPTVPPAAAAGAPRAKASALKGTSSSSDLVYVSSFVNGNVYVLTYPGLSPVTTLKALNAYVAGECSDKTGDVFITTADSNLIGSILEYPHGGKKSVSNLSDAGQPNSCAVDPNSGNLAVTNLDDPNNGGAGDIFIYSNAKGTPVSYSDNQLVKFFYCGYDDKGNLFADGLDETLSFAFAELPKGAKEFTNITIDTTILSGGAVQWDGKYITVVSFATPYAPAKVYRLKVSGAAATVVGTTSLASPNNRHEGQSWIVGKTILGIDNKQGIDVASWAYPGGGNPTKTVKVAPYLAGITVSSVKN